MEKIYEYFEIAISNNVKYRVKAVELYSMYAITDCSISIMS